MPGRDDERKEAAEDLPAPSARRGGEVAGGPLVEVLDVSLSEPLPEELCAASLHKPQPGRPGGASTYSLEVEGSVLGRSARPTGVRLVSDRPLWILPVDPTEPETRSSRPDEAAENACSFRARIGTLRLPTEFELTLKADLVGGARAQFATIKGRRRPLRSDFDPRLRPLMVTTLGRTGSNLLLDLLGAHPEVFAYRPFEHEPCLLGYWLGVLSELAEPASYLRQITPETNVNARGWWLGTQEPFPRRDVEEEVEEWIGFEAIEDLASIFQRRIDSFYSRLADRSGDSRASWFAEKQQPKEVPRFVWELYPDVRELVLIRDFRDMLVSMLRFNEKWNVRAFAGDELGFVAMVGRRVTALAESWRERADRAHLVRYEDLLLRPAETVEGILSYVGLDTSDDAVAAILKRQASTVDRRANHRTSASPERSIGRWRTEVSPELLRACEGAFAPAMELFGEPAGASTRGAG
jgi:hypothetical protein